MLVIAILSRLHALWNIHLQCIYWREIDDVCWCTHCLTLKDFRQLCMWKHTLHFWHMIRFILSASQFSYGVFEIVLSCLIPYFLSSSEPVFPHCWNKLFWVITLSLALVSHGTSENSVTLGPYFWSYIPTTFWSNCLWRSQNSKLRWMSVHP